MTNDFLLKSYNENLALEKGLQLVPRIRGLEDSFVIAGLPIIYSTDRHLKDDFELTKWGPHSMKGTPGSRIIDGLIPEKTKLRVFQRNWKKSDLAKVKENDQFFEVEKGTYSGFSDNGGKPTAMDALLKKLRLLPGDRLYITGLHANCCDKHTAADAFFRGFVPVIVSDCVASFDDPEGKMGLPNEKALVYENFWYDAKIENSEEVKSELSARP
jgi:nicotinamidase-related amidase